MALSPKLQALVEQARRNHAAVQAAKGTPNQATRSEAVRGVSQSQTSQTSQTSVPSSAPLHLKPTVVQATHVGSILTGTSTYQSVTGVPLNEQQNQAVELSMRAKSFNLCGAAGTGKTTTTREIIGQLVRLPHVSPLSSSTKYLTRGEPGVVIISFTNKAVNNIKKFLPEDLKRHCLTYHKLLEYKPVNAFDPLELQALGFGPSLTGEEKKSGMFLPSFNRICKLPHISTIIVEESSMVDTELHGKLLEALPNPELTQFIFLGDLNQLPPIFGPSILGFKLTELPTVELTHVYRQALQSPIITLAHQIREGRGFPGRLEESGFIDDRAEHGKVTIRPWKKKIDGVPAARVCLVNFLIPLVTAPEYDFENSVILCPYNKSFGTIELNAGIAHALSQQRGEWTYEVIARYHKSYWAVGDRVLVDRREAIITKIEATPGYNGPIPELPSPTMDRFGRDPKAAARADETAGDEDRAAKVDDIFDSLVIGEDGVEAKNAASHTITVEFFDTGTKQSLNTAGQINSMLFSYVLTVHKSQGSEWKKVYLLLHYSHNTMLSRELLYTAVTRARQELYVICEPDRGQKDNHIPNSVTRAAKNAEIKGITLEQKAEYFQAKKRSMTRAS